MENIERVKEIMKKDAWDFAKKVAPVYEMLGWKIMTPRGITVPLDTEIYSKILHFIERLEKNGSYSGAGLKVFYKEYEDPDDFEYGIRMEIEKRRFDFDDEMACGI